MLFIGAARQLDWSLPLNKKNILEWPVCFQEVTIRVPWLLLGNACLDMR
jgi:hypothetical protein